MARQINLSNVITLLKIKKYMKYVIYGYNNRRNACALHTMVQIFDHYQVSEYLNIWQKQSGLIFWGRRSKKIAKIFKVSPNFRPHGTNRLQPDRFFIEC